MMKNSLRKMQSSCEIKNNEFLQILNGLVASNKLPPVFLRFSKEKVGDKPVKTVSKISNKIQTIHTEIKYVLIKGEMPLFRIDLEKYSTFIYIIMFPVYKTLDIKCLNVANVHSLMNAEVATHQAPKLMAKKIKLAKRCGVLCLNNLVQKQKLPFCLETQCYPLRSISGENDDRLRVFEVDESGKVELKELVRCEAVSKIDYEKKKSKKPHSRASFDRSHIDVYEIYRIRDEYSGLEILKQFKVVEIKEEDENECSFIKWCKKAWNAVERIF